MPIERIRLSKYKEMQEELDTAEQQSKLFSMRNRRVLEMLRSQLWDKDKFCVACGHHYSERHKPDCVLNNAIEILEDKL
jgi:predicted nucleotidyltransferase component of viral defense system